MKNSVSDKKDLSNFAKITAKMIATNDQAYKKWATKIERFYSKDIDKEDIIKIINNGSIDEQIKTSRDFFGKDGFYRRILIHYATLLKYSGILIPKVKSGQSLEKGKNKTNYSKAAAFCDTVNFPSIFTHCSLRAVIDGCYYGFIQTITDKSLVLMDLPPQYCRTRYTDISGNDIVEFDLRYFNKYSLEEEKKDALSVYPPEVRKEYRKMEKGKRINPWYLFPGGVGVCFPFLDGRPQFLSVIPATIDYDEAVEIERDRDLDEIKKIIVQKVPHNNQNEFLLEPDEVEELHRGAVGMMKNNKNVNILTTYADVEAITSKTSNDAATSTLEKMMSNIYSKSGTSIQLFNSNSNLAIEYSLMNDTALMMTLANKYSIFITNIINNRFSNNNISFKYTFLPITFYNSDKYLDTSLKLGTVGYSFILPALALDLTQSDLSDIKTLETDMLKLQEKLVPLSSSYTQSDGGSGNKPGAPEKSPTEKSDKTIKNEESLQKQGGS